MTATSPFTTDDLEAGRKLFASAWHFATAAASLASLPPADGPLVLTDMPGYGYARAPKTKVAAWNALIHDYLRGRACLARVYVLIDARHGLKSADEDILRTLDEAAVSYQVALTKADQVKAAALADCVAATQATIRQRPAAFPDVLVTSARTGVGVPELRAAIARLLAERALSPRPRPS